MQEIINNHQIVAVFVARVFLGLLFFFQGYDAVFNIKIKGVTEVFLFPLESKGIPKFLIVCGAYFTSYVELIAGLLLIVGFFKYCALYLIGIDLLLVAFAFGLMKPMWDIQYVLPRLILLIFLLVVPIEWDLLSLDHLIFNLK